MAAASAGLKPTDDPSQTVCLARSVMQAFAAEPSLEAVTIDPSRQTVSIATLGKTKLPEATDRVRQTIERNQQLNANGSCTLLTGAESCHTCAQPLSETELRKITIRREGAATTIARVTCPTAPSFWRWRDIPLPRLVQRDVEFLEHEHQVDEWKPQMLAAILCGTLGLGG